MITFAFRVERAPEYDTPDRHGYKATVDIAQPCEYKSAFTTVVIAPDACEEVHRAWHRVAALQLLSCLQEIEWDSLSRDFLERVTGRPVDMGDGQKCLYEWLRANAAGVDYWQRYLNQVEFQYAHHDVKPYFPYPNI